MAFQWPPHIHAQNGKVGPSNYPFYQNLSLTTYDGYTYKLSFSGGSTAGAPVSLITENRTEYLVPFHTASFFYVWGPNSRATITKSPAHVFEDAVGPSLSGANGEDFTTVNGVTGGGGAASLQKPFHHIDYDFGGSRAVVAWWNSGTACMVMGPLP